MTALPPDLAAALARRLDHVSRGDLAGRARRISEGYRRNERSLATVREAADGIAYALTRMPATYAAVATVLRRLAEADDRFAPTSLLDVGAGPGTASFAAAAHWPDLGEAVLADHGPAFLALARDLLADSDAAALRAATVIEADITGDGLPAGPFDLVVASDALTELPEAALPALAAALFARTAGALVVVEPGTPRDFPRLLALRDRLIAAGATIVAPCPHDGACPLTAGDWCHASVRLARSRDHRLVKGADAPFEDERFGYLIAARPGRLSRAPGRRILRPPVTGKADITLALCGPEGLAERTVPRRDRQAHKAAARLSWGDRCGDDYT